MIVLVAKQNLVAFVKLASTAVVSKLLGLSEEQTRAAVSQAFVDGQSLRTYRHSPNAMSRKSWAAGGMTITTGTTIQSTDFLQMLASVPSTSVSRSWLASGVPAVISTPVWGFSDVLFKGKPLEFQRPYGSYVMENVLFKVSYPAEFHSQTVS